MVSAEQIEQMPNDQFERFALDVLNREMGLYGLHAFSASTEPVLEITPATAING